MTLENKLNLISNRNEVSNLKSPCVFIRHYVLMLSQRLNRWYIGLWIYGKDCPVSQDWGKLLIVLSDDSYMRI